MSDTAPPIRVLIADDEALVRAGFRVLVDSAADLVVVGEAGAGGEAVRLTRQLSPDVVLMDIRMPVMDGLEAMRHIASDSTPGRGGSAGRSDPSTRGSHRPRTRRIRRGGSRRGGVATHPFTDELNRVGA